MHQISLWSVFFVSFPEELLIVLVTLTVAGYKEVLNFKDRTNLIKLLLSSTLMVSSTLLGRTLLSSITFNSLIQSIIFCGIIILIYRYKPLNCLGGFLLSLTIMAIGETIFTTLGAKLFNISFSQIYSHPVFSFFVSSPVRILQILVLVIICKKRNIRLNFEKFSLANFIPLMFYFLIIMSSMYSLEEVLTVIDDDSFRAIITLVLNVCIVVVFSAWLIYDIYKIRNKVDINEKMHNFELRSIKKMLEEGHVNHVINLIDCELENRAQTRK